jgi:DeoR family glycerol-3-phosphate regulon repressor
MIINDHKSTKIASPPTVPVASWQSSAVDEGNGMHDSPSMSKYEQDILNAVALRGTIEVGELASLLNVSGQTVRRIVKPMVERGDIRKVHGAIVGTHSVTDPPFLARMAQDKAAKIAIAKKVYELIEDGDVLALDAGSTTGYIAHALRRRRNLTIVTNSSFIASTLSMIPGNRVFMAGAQLRDHDGAAFDKAAFDLIASVRVRCAILSASAVHPRAGFMVQEHSEAELSRAMMKTADKRLMAVDASKFKKRGLLSLPPLSSGDILVTDQRPSRSFANLTKELAVHIADAP